MEKQFVIFSLSEFVEVAGWWLEPNNNPIELYNDREIAENIMIKMKKENPYEEYILFEMVSKTVAGLKEGLSFIEEING